MCICIYIRIYIRPLNTMYVYLSLTTNTLQMSLFCL